MYSHVCICHMKRLYIYDLDYLSFCCFKKVIAANENHEKEIAALKENRPMEDSGKQNDLVELESQIRRLQAENSALQKKCSGQSEIDRDSLSLLLKYMFI